MLTCGPAWMNVEKSSTITFRVGHFPTKLLWKPILEPFIRDVCTDRNGKILTPMYNCARIKLTAPRDGCKLWSMRVIIPPGGSHDQEQDSEYHTRIKSTREDHSRHRHSLR